MSDEGLVNYLVIVLLMFIQTYYYFKVNPTTKIRLPVMVSITLFSMIMTPLLMLSIDKDGGLYSISGTPYIQLFFLVYQVLLFFFSIWEYKLVKSG